MNNDTTTRLAEIREHYKQAHAKAMPYWTYDDDTEAVGWLLEQVEAAHAKFSSLDLMETMDDVEWADKVQRAYMAETPSCLPDKAEILAWMLELIEREKQAKAQVEAHATELAELREQLATKPTDGLPPQWVLDTFSDGPIPKT